MFQQKDISAILKAVKNDLDLKGSSGGRKEIDSADRLEPKT